MSPPLRIALLAAALVVSGCGGANLAATDAVATVNGEPVTRETLDTLVSSQVEPGAAGQPDPARYGELERQQRQTLGELIQDRIVAAAADELGVSVTEEDVEQRFQELADQFGGVEPLREEIKQRGRTEEDVREQLAAVLRSERIAAHFSEQVGVSDAEVREIYERRREAGQMDVAEVAHILVETREEAEQVLDELQQGADFAELAQEHSIDEFSAETGGDLGESPRGRFVEAFDEAVWSASPGDIVGPVQTEFGFHIIRVEAQYTSPFEEERDEIRTELAGSAAQDAFQSWFREALRDADVWVHPRIGEWDPETGTVVAGTSLERDPPPDPGAGAAPTGSPAPPANAPTEVPDTTEPTSPAPSPTS